MVPPRVPGEAVDPSPDPATVSCSDAGGHGESVLAGLPGMAYRCRVDGAEAYQFVSDGCRDLLGCEPGRLLGNRAVDFAQLVHPEDRAVFERRREAAGLERRYDLRYRVRTADGREKWVADAGRGLAAGEARFAVGYLSDITELKRSEAALRSQNEMLALSFSNARDMMLIARVEPGPTLRVQSVNRRYLDVVRAAGFAITREELIGLTFSEVRALFSFSDATWESMMKRFRAVITTRQPVHYDEVTETPHGVFHGVSTITPVCDEAGACRYVLYSSTDLTAHRRAEAAARESELKFEKAFRASPGAMAISEPGKGFIAVNDGYVRMFGYSREELIGKTISGLGLWGDAGERANFLAAFEEHGSVREMEVRRRRRDGTILTCLLSAEQLELGGRRCMISALYDITERRWTEQALRTSEERFSKAFRSVPDAVFVTELASSRVVDVNGGCERIFGYARGECIGRTTFELGIWEHQEDRRRLVAELQQTGGVVRDMEFSGRARDGRAVHVLVSCETIELNGQPHLVTIAHDVTQQKRVEAALRESEARFSTAFRASPGAMAISDLDTRKFVEVNDGFCRILGFSRDEIVGRTAVELDFWSRQEDRERFFDRLMAEGVVSEMELAGRNRRGEEVVYSLSARTFLLGGRSHLITLLSDITSRKHVEKAREALAAQLQQAQKLDALGQLAGGIAHDFNNILTGIFAYTELAMMDAKRPDEVVKHLATVRRASERASDLVRQILTFSRKHARERQPLEVGKVVREALKLLRSSLPKNVAIREETDPAAPVVLADPTQVHQILLNLCTNAAHAMRTGGGTLTVTLRRVDLAADGPAAPARIEPGRYALLSVSDTGEGMDEATLARVFEPFFTTKAPGEGTGLGLAVVHGIVEDHDGAIEVRSRRGEGTTFEVYFPEHATLPAETRGETRALAAAAGQRILFVDDEAVIGSAAGVLLQRFGFGVTVHRDPREALAAFQARPAGFDLVITDLTMPHLDGVELARRMLAIRPDIRIVLATGHSGGWTLEKVRALGIRALVSKPLNMGKLTRAAAEALAGETR